MKNLSIITLSTKSELSTRNLGFFFPSLVKKRIPKFDSYIILIWCLFYLFVSFSCIGQNSLSMANPMLSVGNTDMLSKVEYPVNVPEYLYNPAYMNTGAWLFQQNQQFHQTCLPAWLFAVIGTLLFFLGFGCAYHRFKTMRKEKEELESLLLDKNALINKDQLQIKNLKETIAAQEKILGFMVNSKNQNDSYLNKENIRQPTSGKYQIDQFKDDQSWFEQDYQSFSIDKDQNWLSRLEEHTLAQVKNAQFNLDQVSQSLEMSGRHLQRKLKTLTGLTYTEYLREVRLQKARELLSTPNHKTIKSVVFSVGFRDQKYFTTIFKRRFGKTPSEFLN